MKPSAQLNMQCRAGCGACCIAPSISSFIPGMLEEKRAGQRCIQLNSKNMCQLFEKNNRPAVCTAYQANSDICGDTFEEAMANLQLLELQTGS